MEQNLQIHPLQSEMNQTKRADSLDKIIDQKFSEIADVVNDRLERVYKDFNLAMSAKDKETDRIFATQEIKLTNMVNILHGIVNEQKVRLASLENVLARHEISGEEVDEEYLKNIEILKQEANFSEIPLNALFANHHQDETPGASLIKDEF